MKALITGATSGIGKATAYRFAKEGYNLVLCGRRKDRLEEIQRDLKSRHSNLKFEILVFDVRQRSEVETALSSLPAEWRQIDILVNNAGLALGLSTIDNGDPDDWDVMIDTNVKGLLYVSRIISQWMVEAGKGHIINVGSIAGKEVYPNGNVYCSSKHAVDAITKALRIDLVQYGIKVTQIAPGAVNTEFSTVRFKGDKKRADEVYSGFQPLQGPDIAEVIYYVTTLPSHVNINDLLIMPTAQASSSVLFKQ